MEAALFSLAAAVLILTVALVVLAGSVVAELARLARIRLGHEMVIHPGPAKPVFQPQVDAPPARPERLPGLTDVPSDMDGA